LLGLVYFPFFNTESVLKTIVQCGGSLLLGTLLCMSAYSGRDEIRRLRFRNRDEDPGSL
jgi:hypothetical protein